MATTHIERIILEYGVEELPIRQYPLTRDQSIFRLSNQVLIDWGGNRLVTIGGSLISVEDHTRETNLNDQ